MNHEQSERRKIQKFERFVHNKNIDPGPLWGAPPPGSASAYACIYAYTCAFSLYFVVKYFYRFSILNYIIKNSVAVIVLQ